MGPILIVPAVLLFLLIVWFIGTYNGLVRLRQHVRESWAGIDTELKRRYDLIPNLVETVKGYARHERETLESVVRSRAAAADNHGTPAEQARDENELIGSLRHLFAIVEGYPELKASSHFLHLQKELVNTEDRIQAARRFYNANVRDLNTRIESFPSNVVASQFRFESGEFFDVEDRSVTVPPSVNAIS